jgi:hypothetical protein
MPRRRNGGLAPAIGLCAAIVAAGCGGGTAGGAGAGGQGSAGAPAEAGAQGDAGAHTVVLHPKAAPLPGETACEVRIVTGISIPSRNHVPVCTHVDYATNPPSGGDHWPIWAAFKEHTLAVPREMYVHDLEHGAVVMAYRCDGPCPVVVKALEAAFAGKKPDPVCPPGGPPARLVITPDPKLAAPIGLAAWGATYVATCVDPPSLAAFVESAYGHGPEVECADGVDIEADPSVLATCGGGG